MLVLHESLYNVPHLTEWCVICKNDIFFEEIEFQYYQQPNIYGLFLEEDFSNNFKPPTKTVPTVGPVNPKQFCDDIYMRLMNVFFVITDENQTAKTQHEIIQVVNQIEQSFTKH